MKKISTTIGLFAIIIIAVFFRLYNIKSVPPGLYPDEAMNGSNALEAIETGNFKAFYPENNGREGFFINIQAMFVESFGNHPWVLRSASAIFGILTVIAIYFLAFALFKNKKIGLWSAFFCSVSFWHINFSRIGFRAIMAPFFLTIASYFFIKALNIISENAKDWKKIFTSSAIGGFLFGLGLHSYIAYRATPLLIVIVAAYWLIKEKSVDARKKIILSFLTFTFFAAAAAIPLFIYFAQNPADFFGRTSQISVFSSPTMIKDLSLNIVKTLGMFNFVGDGNWRHNFSYHPELSLPVGILFVLGIGLLILAMIKKEKRENLFPAIFLASWMVISFLPVVISNEGLPHALRSILMIPAAMIIAGFGVFWTFDKLSKKLSPKLLLGVKIGLCAFLIINTYINYFVRWANNSNTQGAFAVNYVEIANQINSLPKETPKYIVVETGGTLVRGIPMPSQTVMFLTKSFTEKEQIENNIHYVLPQDAQNIPTGSEIFYIK